MDKDNIQDQFMDRLKDGRQAATVITINGYQMMGRIVDHDQHAVLMEVNGQKQLVYKTAISTIKEV